MSSLLDTLRRRAANNAWSNLRLHRAVAQLSPEDFLATNRTSFFPSIVETLNHILVVDWFYIDALERGGKGRAIFDDMMPFRDAPSLGRAQRASDDRLLAFTNALTDEGALARIVELERDDHVQRETVLDTLLHLYMLNRGVLMTPFHMMALMSPATTEADVDAHTAALREFAGEIMLT